MRSRVVGPGPFDACSVSHGGCHLCWCPQEFVCLIRPLREHTKNADIEAFCYLPFTWKFLLSQMRALGDGTTFNFISHWSLQP